MNKSYLFTVVLRGIGTNDETAWEDAVDAFTNDPGEPHTIQYEGKI